MLGAITHLTIECKPNQQSRVLIEYDGVWRPIFWLSVSRKGDIYLGPRRPNPDEMRVGIKEIEGGKTTHKYTDGRKVTDPRILAKGGKLSFHTSGAINAAGQRSFREPFCALAQTEILCVMLLQHPSQFEAEHRPGKRDLLLHYPIDEGRPLIVQVYVAPADNSPTVVAPTAMRQENLSFVYAGLEEIPDLTVQLLLYHHLVGPWPQLTSVVWPSKRESVTP